MENHELEKNLLYIFYNEKMYILLLYNKMKPRLSIIYRGGLPSSGSGLIKSWVSYSKFSICEKDSGKFWHFDRLHNIKVDKKKSKSKKIWRLGRSICCQNDIHTIKTAYYVFWHLNSMNLR